jgi:hypothetical protein
VEPGDPSGLSAEKSNAAMDDSLHVKPSSFLGHSRSRLHCPDSNVNYTMKRDGAASDLSLTVHRFTFCRFPWMALQHVMGSASWKPFNSVYGSTATDNF